MSSVALTSPFVNKVLFHLVFCKSVTVRSPITCCKPLLSIGLLFPVVVLHSDLPLFLLVVLFTLVL